MTPLGPRQLSLWGDDPSPAPGPEGPATTAVADGRLISASLDVAGDHEPSVCTLPCFRHPQADREIRLGKAIIAYEFKRAHRRSIGMVVGPEGLSVRAPRWVSIGDVEAALRSKEQWLCKKLLEQRERVQRDAQARIEWVDGGLVPFLGRPCRLVLQPELNGVALSADERSLLVGLGHHATSAQVKDQAIELADFRRGKQSSSARNMTAEGKSCQFCSGKAFGIDAKNVGARSRGSSGVGIDRFDRFFRFTCG